MGSVGTNKMSAHAGTGGCKELKSTEGLDGGGLVFTIH